MVNCGILSPLQYASYWKFATQTKQIHLDDTLYTVIHNQPIKYIAIT